MAPIVLSAFGEGFLAGTKVKTSGGYQYIENLNASGFVSNIEGSHGCAEQSILARAIRDLHCFVKIGGKNTSICVARCQQFYLPHAQSWIAAHDLHPGDVLGADFVIDYVEIVYHAAQAHIIAVDKHQFLITEHDILVHN